LDAGSVVIVDLIPHSKPWIHDSDVQAVGKVLQSHMIARGDTIRIFERAVSAECCAIDGIGQSSGTAALLLALRALGIGAGDEVVLPTYVCRNVLDAIAATGAEPSFADVDELGLLTTSTVRSALSPRTRAVIAVHLFGNSCDVEGLRTLGYPVIEDACQAVGLESHGKKAGSRGDLGILSFHATKMLTTGEGGMLVSTNATLLEKARSLISHSRDSSPCVFAPMSDLQAALGLSQLQRLDIILGRRRSIAARYDESLSRVSRVTLPQGRSRCIFRYILRSESGFDSLETHFRKHGICVRRGVDALLHRLRGEDDSRYPTATRLLETTVSIPCYPALTDTGLDRICHALAALR
jgi:dTDP-4-amino-4,6-dideoxygalactose transaminase